jgi:hypothetical protein
LLHRREDFYAEEDRLAPLVKVMCHYLDVAHPDVRFLDFDLRQLRLRPAERIQALRACQPLFLKVERHGHR